MFDKMQKTVLIGMTALCTAAIIVAYGNRPEPKPTEYIPPSFEAGAVKGSPDTEALTHYSSMELPLSEGNCIVSMEAAPKLNDSTLDVYFTNEAENDVWLKLVIFDAEENIIGESGILKEGEYVQSVTLNEAVRKGQRLNTKILTYEADTYYSMGSVAATIYVG